MTENEYGNKSLYRAALLFHSPFVYVRLSISLFCRLLNLFFFSSLMLVENQDHSEEHKLGNFATCPVRGSGTSGFVEGNRKGQSELGQWHIDVQEDFRAGNTLISTC